MHRHAGAAVAAALVGLAGCSDLPPPGRGVAWNEADGLFGRDARFVGADGAYSIDLGGERILWTFGDTFVARDPRHVRDNAYFLRNSVALQTGRDPTHAFLQSYWRYRADGAPASFLPEPDDTHWFWPAHGIRVDGTLLLFYEELVQDGAPGPDRYASAGWTAVVVDDPDDEPSRWTPRPAQLPEAPPAGGVVQLGEAVLREGDFVYVYGTRGATHATVLARFALTDVVAGELARPAWFCGGRFDAACEPESLVELGMPEFSVHREGDAFWLVGSSGYGATTLSWRRAPAPEGPWSDVRDVYRPPESFAEGAFVYAGKAHPELDGQGGLVATYVPSSSDDLPDALADRYYVPHFVRLYLK